MATGTELEKVGRVPEPLWQRIKAEPDRTPEYIALAAAERFAPQAEAWAAQGRAWHTPESLARAAFNKHVHMARLEGAALGVGGAVTAAADIVALLWIQSRMIFYIAAAYGYDPRHPMRPAELLALQGVYPTAAEARQALDGAGKRLGLAVAERALDSRRDQHLGVKLAKFAGRRIARRYTGRLVPFLASPIGAVQNGAATKDLGQRAIAYYGGDQARP